MRKAPAFAAMMLLLLATYAVAAGEKQIDVAAVITKADAAAALGEPVRDPNPRNHTGENGYYSSVKFYPEKPGKSLVISVRLPSAGKTTAAQEFDALVSGSKSGSKPVPGLGDKASFFSGDAAAQSTMKVLMLYVVKGDAFVQIGLGGLKDEAVALERQQALAQKILAQL